MARPRLSGVLARAKQDLAALYLAARDPRVPFVTKLIAGFAAAYALSPVDLIPDFVPVIGMLDDVVIVPALLALAIWLIPACVMRELRARAASAGTLPPSAAAAAVIIAVWIASAVGIGALAYRYLAK
jgi:uncharacterized membrane protein YkvA (DUF1232 family)